MERERQNHGSQDRAGQHYKTRIRTGKERSCALKHYYKLYLIFSLVWWHYQTNLFYEKVYNSQRQSCYLKPFWNPFKIWFTVNYCCTLQQNCQRVLN